jgi:6-phosphogluconolactonase
MKYNLHIFKTPEELADVFAGQMMNWIENHSGKAFHLAISGGKTPDLLFAVLAARYADSILWQKIHFWWVDERMVLPDEPESNFGVANKLLFSKINLPEENIHRIKGENAPEVEALSYSEQIQDKLTQRSGWPQFDLILLGMGDDGHTASIFPDQMHLLNSKLICEVAVHPQSGQKRVTLTGQVISHALKICFLVTGSNKAARMADIWTNPEIAKLLPAAHIRPINGDLQWYVDKSAFISNQKKRGTQ